MSNGMLLAGGECSRCYGCGTVNYGKDDATCGSCLGTGREMTALGREMLVLLEELYDIKPKVKA